MNLFWRTPGAVLVQGPLTSRCQSIITRMREFGTTIAACVYPTIAESSFQDIPCYCSIVEALEAHPDIQASIIVVHSSHVKSLALEAIDAALKVVVITTQYVPVQDSLVIAQEASFQKVQVIGPASQGILIPGQGLFGCLTLDSGFPPATWLESGPIAIVTRSAAIGLFLTYTLKKEGQGITALVDLGKAQSRCGLGFDDLLALLENETDCQITIIVPEINALDYNAIVRARERGLYTKPILAFVPENQTFQDIFLKQSYQLISSNMIIEKLKEADVNIWTTLENIPQAIAETIKQFKG
ncbi:hypothetical protein JXQ70_20430 [bacterium]|nr:hypothetical protein [bacterium]